MPDFVVLEYDEFNSDPDTGTSPGHTHASSDRGLEFDLTLSMLVQCAERDGGRLLIIQTLVVNL